MVLLQIKQINNLKNDNGIEKIEGEVLEAESAGKGDYIQDLISLGGFNNILDRRWSEDERIGLAKYIGAKIKLEKQAAKLETQRKRLDLYKGQLKLVENGTSVVEYKEEAIRDLNLKIVDAEAAIRNTKAEAAKTAEEVVELKSKYSQIINLTYD